MKKILLFAVAAIMVACAPSNTYTVVGEVEGGKYEGNNAFIYSMRTQKPLDTAVVVGGKFMFEGVVDTADIVLLRIDGSRVHSTFILEPGMVETVVVDKDAVKVSGTGLNVVLQKMRDAERAIYAEYSKIKEDLKAKYKEDKDALQTELSKINLAQNEKLNELYNGEFTKNKTNVLGLEIYTSKMVNDKNVADIKEFVKQNTYAAIHAPLKPIIEAKVNEEKTAVGMKFTDFDARNMADTKDVKLSDYVGKGKYVVADFWASWCAPCRAEMPHLADLDKKYAKKGLVILGVNVSDTHDAALKTIKDLDMTWAQIYVPTRGYATGLYGIQGIPTIIIFAPDGTIVHRSHGGIEMQEFVKNIYK